MIDKGETGKLSNTSVGGSLSLNFSQSYVHVFYMLSCVHVPAIFLDGFICYLSYQLQLILISFSIESVFIISLSINPTHVHQEIHITMGSSSHSYLVTPFLFVLVILPGILVP